MRPPHLSTPGKGAVFASAAVHGAFLLGAWWVHVSYEPRIEYLVYEMELFSPPPAQSDVEQLDPDPAPPEELVVETPDPTPPAPDPAPVVPPPVERPQREDPPPPPVRERESTPPPPPPVREEPVRPRTTTETTRPSPASGDDINIQMEGLQRDYPLYYQNIIVQIRRCFRWREGGGWSTRVRFEIGRAGSVSNIRVVQPSGNVIFDIEAEGAIECAGGRFGELPETLQLDRLPVEFVFTPDR